MADSDSASPGKAAKPGSKARQQEALNAILVAAEMLARTGEIIEAEARFKQALAKAEKEFGGQSDQTILILSILAAFYHQQNRQADAGVVESRIELWQMQRQDTSESDPGALGRRLTSKKAKQAAAQAEQAGEPSQPKSMSPQIRKACQVLGLSPEETLTVQAVNAAWKNQMLATSAHPDLGGNTEEAVILNHAKETLFEYLEYRAPKLGKKFKKQS